MNGEKKRGRRQLRQRLGIDDYSWRKFRSLPSQDQDKILLFLESLSPDFEKHPDRWGSCLSMLSRDYVTANRWLVAALNEAER